MHAKIFALALALCAGAPSIVRADPVALPEEHHVLAWVTASGRYDRLPGEIHSGQLALSARVLLGERVGYCAGVDAEAGASGEGAIYRAEAMLAGVGVRIGDAGMVSLCGGAGVGGAADVVPTALQLPVELRALTQVGPLRISSWVTARFIPLDEVRNQDDPIDELEATLAIGLGSQQRYWRGASAKAAPYVAATYRELLDEHVFGIAVGIELLGAN